MSSRKGKKTEAVATGGRAFTIVNTIIAFLALAGLLDATYLTVLHMAGETAACGSSMDCSAVLGSSYSTIAGRPVASFGIIAYFTVFSSALLVAFGYRKIRLLLVLAVTGMFLATLWFLYLQAFVLHAFCPYCLFSAALVFLMAGLLLAVPARSA